jgi:DNA-binding XRE family transcriptional regulator
MKPKAAKPEKQSQPKRYQPPKAVSRKHQKFLTSIGLGLQNLRKEKNLSISRLSDTLEISRNQYAQMESGKVYCNILSVLQVLDFHHVDAKRFFHDLQSNRDSSK